MSQQKTWTCAICNKTTRRAGIHLLGAKRKICRACYNKVGAQMEAAGLITKSAWGGWNWEVLPSQLQEPAESIPATSEESKHTGLINHVHMRLSFDLCFKVDMSKIDHPAVMKALNAAMADPKTRSQMVLWESAYAIIEASRGDGASFYELLSGDKPREGQHFIEYEQVAGDFASYTDPMEQLFDCGIIKVETEELSHEHEKKP